MLLSPLTGNLEKGVKIDLSLPIFMMNRHGYGCENAYRISARAMTVPHNPYRHSLHWQPLSTLPLPTQLSLRIRTNEKRPGQNDLSRAKYVFRWAKLRATGREWSVQSWARLNIKLKTRENTQKFRIFNAEYNSGKKLEGERDLNLRHTTRLDWSV